MGVRTGAGHRCRTVNVRTSMEFRTPCSTIFGFFLADTVFVLFVLGRRRYWSLFGLISCTHILVLAIVHVILVLLELVDLLQLICFGFKNIYSVQNLSCLMEVIGITILGSVFSSSAMICFLHKPSVLLCDQSAFTDLTTYWNGRNGKLRITLNETWLLLRTCYFFQRRQFLILASLYDTYQRHPN